MGQQPGLIAVIDLETTGLFPHRHDRVVEIAAVVVAANGSIEREFVSLVNPNRDIGPSSIHGLSAEDLLGAPAFEELASLFVGAVEGSIAIASHNMRFDHQFLEAEFARIGQAIPSCRCLCTMELAGGGSLVRCCDDYGVRFDGSAHHALADARAAALLLACILEDSPRLMTELESIGPIPWPRLASSSCTPLTRVESRRRREAPPTYLQRLASRLDEIADHDPEDGASLEYLALLDRVLEDRQIEDTEGDALLDTATRWGLSMQSIKAMHEQYLERLAIAAWDDGVVTDAERKDLTLVSRLLGLDSNRLDEVIRRAKLMEHDTSTTTSGEGDSDLVGKRVCFTGEFQCKHGGVSITREVAEQLAVSAGIEVVDSVTKKLDVLVVADPHTQSGKANKARKYGIRILHEPVFWSAINISVS